MTNNIEMDLAKFAAFTSGEFIKKEIFKEKNITYKTSNTDLVTKTDKAAENIIRNLIKNTFPHHAILGEEEVSPGVEASVAALEEKLKNDHLWIIDPIDGTTNFIHGFPYFCVSIAYVEKKEIKIGVIYNPMMKELFVAQKGSGATLNGIGIKVTSETSISNSLLSTSIPKSEKGIKTLLKLGTKVRGIRVPGSAALQLADVAGGRLDGFWEMNLNAWDIAAGALIVKEAGGHITDVYGKEYCLDTRDVVTTNKSIHKQAIKILEECL